MTVLVLTKNSDAMSRSDLIKDGLPIKTFFKDDEDRPVPVNKDDALLRFYLSIGKLITSSLEFDEILAGIMQEIQHFFNPSHWSLFRFDRGSQELFFVLTQGIDIKLIEDIRLKSGEGIAGHVVKTGQPLFVADARTDERFSQRVDEQTGFETRSIVAVPLKFRDQVYGVLELINRFDDGSYTERDFIILQSIADFSAIAFANALLYEESKDMAHRDPLTGVSNRRHLEYLQNEWAGRRNDDASYVVVMIDLDNFKTINDTYGHHAGDQVLRFLTQFLQQLVRDTDRVFRIGGDEFLILIRHPEPDRASEVMARLENGLTDLQKQCKQHEPAFGFSFGFSFGSFTGLTQIMQRADTDMYSRKKNAGMRPPFKESADS